MLKKLFISAVLVGSALATGATASAGDIASTTPTPPPPPPMVPIGDYATNTGPRVATYTIPCLGSTACDSLAKWCSDHGGTYTDWDSPRGETKGLCSG